MKCNNHCLFYQNKIDDNKAVNKAGWKSVKQKFRECDKFKNSFIKELLENIT